MKKKKVPALPAIEGVTRYRALYEVLRKEVKRKRSRTLLTSEPELARRYRVSRNTVRLALGMLEREGLIERVKGSGTYST
jgi:DNA-binding GntR family transcriptional regulator